MSREYLAFLTEAPMASYELHGDWSDDQHHVPAAQIYKKPFNKNGKGPEGDPNSFLSRIDRTLVQKPETKEKLTKFLSRFGIDFYFLMVNSPNGQVIADKHLDAGDVDMEGLEEIMGPDVGVVERVKEIRATNRRACIIILTHNEGGEVRHPLTPWMIIHRAAHAMNGAIINLEQEHLRTICLAYGWTERMMREIVPRLATMKAARDQSFIKRFEIGELKCELIAQFICTGSVKFHLPEVIEDETKNKTNPDRFLRLKPSMAKSAREALAAYEEKMNESLALYFDELVAGRIMVC